MPPGILYDILPRRSTLMFYRTTINFDVNLAIDYGNITEISKIKKHEILTAYVLLLFMIGLLMQML